MNFIGGFKDELVKIALNKAEKVLLERAAKKFMSSAGVNPDIRFRSSLSPRIRRAFSRAKQEGRAPLGVTKKVLSIPTGIEARTRRPAWAQRGSASGGFASSPQHTLFHEAIHAIEGTPKYVDDVLPIAKKMGLRGSEQIADSLGAFRMNQAIEDMARSGAISRSRAERLLSGRPLSIGKR